MIFTEYPKDFWHKRKIDKFDPYNVFLAFATNIPVLLMTGFVVQGHIYYFLLWNTKEDIKCLLLLVHTMKASIQCCFGPSWLSLYGQTFFNFIRKKTCLFGMTWQDFHFGAEYHFKEFKSKAICLKIASNSRLCIIGCRALQGGQFMCKL